MLGARRGKARAIGDGAQDAVVTARGANAVLVFFQR